MVEYMDSDEEEKKKKKNQKKRQEAVEELRVAEGEKEEKEEKVYSFSPMQEWIPSEKAQTFTFLNFRPVELPSSSSSHRGNPVRSTIVGEFGRSVVIGPHPTDLPWAKRHSSRKLMMVTPDQLRAHLFHQVEKSKSLNSGTKVKTSKRPGRVLDKALETQLQAAVTPWIGNLLIPATSRLTVADALRERGEKSRLTSTAIFQLFLQTMNVDSVGCKKMIEKRRSGVVFVTPPPDPSSLRLRNPNTIAGMLQRRRMAESSQEFDQLQTRPPVTSSQNHHGVLLQRPPNMCPQMSPKLFPQAIFIPASIQLPPPSSMATPPSFPPVAVTSPEPAPPAPQRLNSVVQVPTSPSSAGHPVPALLDNQDAVPSSSSRCGRRRQQVVEAVGSSGNGLIVGGAKHDVGGAHTCLDGADAEKKDGRRNRKLTAKAKALQEAAVVKVTVVRTSHMSRCRCLE